MNRYGFAQRCRTLLGWYLLGLTFLGTVLFSPLALATIDINNSFSPSTLKMTEKSRLLITLQNYNGHVVNSASFDNVLPDYVLIADPPNISNTCDGSVSQSNTTLHGQIGLSGGVIPAHDGSNPGSCQIGIDVYSSRQGTYIDTIAAGDLTAVSNGNPESNAQDTTATLAVVIKDLETTIHWQHMDDPTLLDEMYIQGDETGYVVIDIKNPNIINITGLAFLADFADASVPLQLASTTPTINTCGGTVDLNVLPAYYQSQNASFSIRLTGGNIVSQSACQIKAKIKPGRLPTRSHSASWNHLLKSIIPLNSISSNEGATNIEDVTAPLHSITGIVASVFFDGLEKSNGSFDTKQTFEYTLLLENYNASPITGASIQDKLPAGLTFTGINSNSCGGNVDISTANDTLILTGASIPGAAGEHELSERLASCEVKLVGAISAPNVYYNELPDDQSDEGVLVANEDYSFEASSATLEISEPVGTSHKLGVAVEFSKDIIYQGDSVDLIISLSNTHASDTASNITIEDTIEDLCWTDQWDDAYCPGGASAAHTYFRIGDKPLENNCNGNLIAPAGGMDFRFENGVLEPGQQCEFRIPVQLSADAMYVGGSPRTLEFNLPGNQVTYDWQGETAKVHPEDESAEIEFDKAIKFSYEKFTPAIVASNGVSRFKVELYRRTTDHSSTSDIHVAAHLTNAKVAAVPNATSTCGGVFTAEPGSTTFSLDGASLPGVSIENIWANNVRCIIELDVEANPLADDQSVGEVIAEFYGDAHGSPNGFSAKDDAQAEPYNQLESLYGFKAKLQVRDTNLFLSQEYLPPTINGGQASRARIVLSNTESTAIDLSDLVLPVPLGSDGLILHANTDPAFTDSNGSVNSNGCSGGQFDYTPSGNSITLRKANIKANSTCYFEFNLTGTKGGNITTTLPAETVSTREGVTNPSPVSVTLTVGRHINAAVSYEPAIIEAGASSDLVLKIYNSLSNSDQVGSNPAIVHNLPSAVQITGTPSTTCAGGNVSVDTSGSNHSVTLAGGEFVSESTCEIRVPVSSTIAGKHNSVIEIGDLQTTSGASNPHQAEGSLFVLHKPTINKSFSESLVGVNKPVKLNLRVENPVENAVMLSELTNISFSDTLVGMKLATPAKLSHNCPNLQHNIVNGGSSIAISGINLLAGANCTVVVEVVSDLVGSHDNTVTGPSSDQTPTPGDPSTATLNVVEPLRIKKSFLPTSIIPGGVSRMTITLENPNNVDLAIENVDGGFRDEFPSSPGQMVLSDSPNVNTTCAWMSLRNLADTESPEAGDEGFLTKNGTVPANGSCQIQANVTADTLGNYANISSTLHTVAGESSPASAFLLVTSDAAGYDWGDAPASYNGSFDTSHLIHPDFYLGTSVDAESGPPAPLDGTGDDVTGSDDEDGITLPATFMPGDTVTLRAKVNGAAGYLSAWIDWDADGYFSQAEYVAANIQDGGSEDTDGEVNGTIVFDVSVPATASAGDTYARFRWSDKFGLGPSDNITNYTKGASVKMNASTDVFGEIEDYAVTVMGSSNTLTGTVFEDLNYGGGAGRSLSTSGGVGINGARIELYDASGAVIQTTISANNGSADGVYEFPALTTGDYYVRVVNSTVHSSRGGSTGVERAVQTFRGDASSGIVNEVGGRNPAVADADSNTTSLLMDTSTFKLSNGQQVQSVHPLHVTSGSNLNVSFGFNFNTIVNTNDAGQGSLRQFIVNNNILDKIGLAQDGLPAGIATSVFEIPGTGPHIIRLNSMLPDLSGAGIALDATTQDGTDCSLANRKLMIELDGQADSLSADIDANGLYVKSVDVTIRGLALGHFKGSAIRGDNAASHLQLACLNLGMQVDGNTSSRNNAQGIWLQNSSHVTIGGSEDQRLIIAGNGADAIRLDGVQTADISHNYIGLAQDGSQVISVDANDNPMNGTNDYGISLDNNAANINITNNWIAGNNNSAVKIYNSDTINLKGNMIGLSVDGVSKRPNIAGSTLSDAVALDIFNTNHVALGGLNAGDRNVIAGNDGSGVRIYGSNDVSLLGNYIGTDQSGSQAVGNKLHGITIRNSSSVTIGNGTSSGRNIIAGNGQNGIDLNSSTGAVISGNYIGIDATGLTALANASSGTAYSGIKVNASPNVIIGGANLSDGNVISGNAGTAGVYITGNSAGSLLQNNVIGLLADGSTAAGNSVGIQTYGGKRLLIRNNVISGNRDKGVWLESTPDSQITGNKIGTSQDESVAVGNAAIGLQVSGGLGDLVVRDNLIAANTKGLYLKGHASYPGGVVAHNRIGLPHAGADASFANSEAGILVEHADGLRIGATTLPSAPYWTLPDTTYTYTPDAEANYILGNGGDGIVLHNDDGISGSVIANQIESQSGNGISLEHATEGWTVAGNIVLNNQKHGLFLQNLAANNKITANTISGNTWSGISHSGTGTGNTYSKNSIYDNGTLGIDLGSNGVTVNDPGDGDSGPNHLLNFPETEPVSFGTNGTLTVTYSLDLDSSAGDYRIEFFANDTADSTGHGEGKYYIGYANINHLGGQENYKGVVQDVPYTLAKNTLISATLTNVTEGSSSEFSGTKGGNTGVCEDLLTGSGLNLTVDEGAPVIAYINTYDSNGEPITYVINQRLDADQFVILGPEPGAQFSCSKIVFLRNYENQYQSGAVSKSTGDDPGNYENPQDADGDNVYELEITAKDSQGNANTSLSKIVVSNINEAPYAMGPSVVDYEEDQPISQVVQRYYGYDSDADDEVTLSLYGGLDHALFRLDSQGDLYFRHSPDYESPMDSNRDNIYEVEISATDRQGYMGFRTFKIKVTDRAVDNGVRLQVRALLQGAYDSSTGLMQDKLRQQGIITLSQPYNGAPFDYAGTERINLDLVQNGDADGLVDWVLVELWSATEPTQRVASRAALIQRDGDLMDAWSGYTTLHFAGVAEGAYHVALRHRNHLAVLTADALALSKQAVLIDFSSPELAVSGEAGRWLDGERAILWSGDIDQDGRLFMHGSGNDMNHILIQVLKGEGNREFNANYRLAGYRPTDLNMDGETLFSGPGTDTTLLLRNVLAHPHNTHFMGNFVIKGSIVSQ
ncbi:MAG: hypothetical protein CR991_06640 [Proteobacteria bacterium]|nr:MAG: hypothetical protein CR991_06640 [Pseudomonadota bacterium]